MEIVCACFGLPSEPQKVFDSFFNKYHKTSTLWYSKIKTKNIYYPPAHLNQLITVYHQQSGFK